MASAAEIASILAEIRERVAARHPSSAPGGIPLPDLLPILHARDAAHAKVAAIGTVNPRPGGLLNNFIQFIKRTVSRSLDWHVREQVEFNRAMVSAVEAILQTLEENNRLLARIAADAEEMRDARSHWIQWRTGWEEKLATNETQFLRSIADLQTAYQHRASLMESNFRDLIRAQHTDFAAALEKANLEIQQHLWADLERIRLQYESIIHNELRLVRQRASLIAPSPAPVPPPPSYPVFDYLKFSEKFRGPEDYVKSGQARYIEKFKGCKNVLDLGCGRGEFLELMRDNDVTARGIELSSELVAMCRNKGLQAEEADLFTYLASAADQSFDGIFSAQVVEHLPPERLPDLIRLAHAKLARGAWLVIETPNPECLAIFATHFYIDPTHTRPIPPALLAFYFEESGFGHLEVQRFSPAIESMPSLASLPADFREAFFANLDYAVLGRRLS
jgi:2-polyprenyl-3-methyl-5-hydroxy-6-metoxy-1,4-benzoquinol methylase